MPPAWQAFANAALPVRAPVWDPRFVWSGVALVAVILVGALLIVLVDRWRKLPVEESPNPHDQLASFRELYEQGELSQEEFDRIRTRLSAGIRPAAAPQQAPEQAPRPAEPPGDGAAG